MDNDVVATVASRRPGEELGIVACQQPKNEATSTVTVSRQFQFLNNPCRDTVVKNTVPIVIDPKNPNVSLDDSDPAAQQKLIEYVQKRWWGPMLQHCRNTSC
jgi:hypothetical protein